MQPFVTPGLPICHPPRWANFLDNFECVSKLPPRDTHQTPTLELETTPTLFSATLLRPRLKPRLYPNNPSGTIQPIFYPKNVLNDLRSFQLISSLYSAHLEIDFRRCVINVVCFPDVLERVDRCNLHRVPRSTWLSHPTRQNQQFTSVNHAIDCWTPGRIYEIGVVFFEGREKREEMQRRL